MARGSIELKGMDILVKKLKKNANLDDVKKTVSLNGTEMQRKAKRYAPNDTGHLEREIKYYPEDNGFTAKVASEADYAGFQEYGTRYQPGTPHIRPAYHEQKRQFIKDMKRIMK